MSENPRGGFLFNRPNYYNYTVSIGEALLFLVITLFLGQLVSGLVVAPTFLNPELSNVLLPLSFFLGFGSVVFVIMIMKRLNFTDIKAFFHTRIKLTHLIAATGLYIVSLPIAEYLSMVVPTEGIPWLEELYKMFEDGMSMIFDHTIAAFIMVCILAPLLEELIFRGLILRGLLQKGVNPWFAIALTALIFGFAHLNPWQFMGAGFIGIMLGFIYWRTQSLWLVIFLHALNNFIAFAITLQAGTMDEMVFEENNMLLLGAVFFTLALIYYLYKITQTTALDKADDFQETRFPMND